MQGGATSTQCQTDSGDIIPQSITHACRAFQSLTVQALAGANAEGNAFVQALALCMLYISIDPMQVLT